MKVQIKSLLALAVLGYVFMLIIRYVEGIILSLLKIIGLVFNVNLTVFEFIDIIPQLLTIAFWLILIFVYLKKISWKIDLSNEFPKYFVVIIGVSTITLFLFLIGIRYAETRLLASRGIEYYYYYPEPEILIIKTLTLSFLNFIEVLIIALGFIKMFKRKSMTASNSATINF